MYVQSQINALVLPNSFAGIDGSSAAQASDHHHGQRRSASSDTATSVARTNTPEAQGTMAAESVAQPAVAPAGDDVEPGKQVIDDASELGSTSVENGQLPNQEQHSTATAGPVPESLRLEVGKYQSFLL